MAVQFIIGRAGCGKSLHCFRHVVEMLRTDPLGPPIYWIVPKQETFSVERELTCASGLPGFSRARIVSFELLGEEILAECGGTAIPRVTQSGRQMVIGHLLRRHEADLAYFRSAARQAGLAAELDATFAEMERCGRTADDLAMLVHDLEAGSDGTSMLDKVRDLKLLYDKYLAYLGQDRLDPHRRLMHILGNLEKCTTVRGATVFVDGFLEFTDFERRMLTGLAKVCSRLEITLLLDPASPVLENPHVLPKELSLFFRTEDAYRLLWFAFHEAGIDPDAPLILDKVHRFSNPALRHIEQQMVKRRHAPEESAEQIELIEAPDRRAEVDAAARQVRKLVGSGLRLRDIAVLMRNLDDYQELIDASFVEHDISSYFLDRRRSATHHPLLQMIRAVVQIALRNWPHDAVMSLIKSGLASISNQAGDELENYVLLHRIRGSAWTDEKPWAYRRKLTRGEEDLLPAEVLELDRIDVLRRNLAEKMSPLIQAMSGKTPSTIRPLVIELFAVLDRFGTRTTMLGWMKQAHESKRIEEHDEHKQVWSELVKLLDEMVAVVGDETVAAEHFVEILETGLEQFDLAITPPTLDQVIVGAIDRTRGVRPAAVILLGMNDGQFPRVPKESSVLSEDERKTLRRHRLELDPDGPRALLDEQLLGYIALTRASRHLCLIRAAADEESRPQTPSQFWMRVRQQFPTLKPTVISRDPGAIESISTPRQLVTGLMQWVRQGAPENVWAGLYGWFVGAPRELAGIARLRDTAWPALGYTNEASLSPETGSRLFRSPLISSVSQIETFAACPFKHFAQYGLRLTEREEPDITAIDLGIVFHGILEQIVKRMLAQEAGWESSTPQVLSEIADQIGHDLRGELMLSSERNKYILKHIEKTIGRVIASQSAAAERGRLRPQRAELQFGDQTKLGALVLKTPGGNEIRLRGKIDRVDWTPAFEFVVIDYKSRDNTLALDWVHHGLSLQLLIYLLVLARNGSQLSGRKMTPVAAFYVKLLRELEKADYPDDGMDPKDPKFDLRVKPRGIIDFQHRNLIDAKLTTNMSDVASLYVKVDGTIGRRNNSDACESAEFDALLRLAEKKLAELGDRIIAGRIEVSPYRIGQLSPCTQCSFRSVCRFDLTVNRYHPLASMDRETVLKLAMEQAK